MVPLSDCAEVQPGDQHSVTPNPVPPPAADLRRYPTQTAKTKPDAGDVCTQKTKVVDM